MICEDDVPRWHHLRLCGSLTTLRTIRSRSMYKFMDAGPVIPASSEFSLVCKVSGRRTASVLVLYRVSDDLPGMWLKIRGFRIIRYPRRSNLGHCCVTKSVRVSLVFCSLLSQSIPSEFEIWLTRRVSIRTIGRSKTRGTPRRNMDRRWLSWSHTNDISVLHWLTPYEHHDHKLVSFRNSYRQRELLLTFALTPFTENAGNESCFLN